MPIPIPSKDNETPVRRQITSVNFSVILDTADEPAQIPTLTATICFTDLYRNAEGLPVAYGVSGNVVIPHAELIALPNSLAVLGAVQALAYQRAAEQGI